MQRRRNRDSHISMSTMKGKKEMVAASADVSSALELYFKIEKLQRSTRAEKKGFDTSHTRKVAGKGKLKLTRQNDSLRNDVEQL